MLLVSHRSKVVTWIPLVVAVCSLHWTAASILAQQTRTLRFDFGGHQSVRSTAWNQATKATVAGTLVTDAKDTHGTSTAVALDQIDAWSGTNTDGAMHGSPYPSAASSDSFYIGDDGDRQATLLMRGLLPGRAYELRFFASRMNPKAVGREAIYQVGSARASLSAGDNVGSVAKLSRCLASAQGDLLIEIQVAPTSQFAYLGVLELSGYLHRLEEVRAPLSSLEAAPETSAVAWAIGDGTTGTLLSAKLPYGAREMASTTKIMTALLVAELARAAPKVLDEQVKVSKTADAAGGSTAGLLAGDRLTVRDVLRGLLLPSGNDAAVVLAQHFGLRFPGAEDEAALARFVAAMNRRAQAMGLRETRYFDPHGNSRNRSCAADLLLVAAEAMKHETLRGIFKTRRYVATVTAKNGRERRIEWRNTNQMLRFEGVSGVKTGTTRGAGACLVTKVEVDGRSYMVVVLGASLGKGRYIDTKNLIQWVRRQPLRSKQTRGK